MPNPTISQLREQLLPEGFTLRITGGDRKYAAFVNEDQICLEIWIRDDGQMTAQFSHYPPHMRYHLKSGDISWPHPKWKVWLEYITTAVRKLEA